MHATLEVSLSVGRSVGVHVRVRRPDSPRQSRSNPVDNSDPNKFFGHPMNKAGYTAISRELSRRLVIGRRVFAVSLLMSLSQIRS